MMGWETSAPDTCRCHGRHCQTLPTRALTYHTGQWSPPHCSSVTPDIASFGTEDTNSLEAFFSYSSDCCFLINIIGSLFNVFLMRGKKMSIKLKHETSQKIFLKNNSDLDGGRLEECWSCDWGL